ncbi:hypothetical protein TNCV_1932771 [Trichonephila clavipes]|nr:hypothetical protein TNCV_1932771 [Trichonephila clavipes]
MNLIRGDSAVVQVAQVKRVHFRCDDTMSLSRLRSSSSNSHLSRNLLRHFTTIERHRVYSSYTAFIRRCILRPPTPSALFFLTRLHVQ